MAKNFATIYASSNDANALEQKIYIKEETVRGTMVVPANTDFIFHRAGGSHNFSQPVRSSDHKSGRHHTSIIKEKTSTEWSLPTYVSIDETLGAAADTQIDPAMRVLLKSMLGRETTGPLTYSAADDPSTSFSFFEIGDQFAKQSPGNFVESLTMNFPGDGDASFDFAGMGKTQYMCGIGQSTTNNTGGNTVTLQAGEGERFFVGGIVMLIEGDGTTKSADTPLGSPRTVTAIAGDVVTVDGVALGDADGSGGAGTEIYLVYYDPSETGTEATAINNPVTGLSGSVSIVGLSNVDCVRSATITLANNHKLYNDCYGEEGLSNKLFAPNGRLTVELSLVLIMNKDLVGFINSQRNFEGENITIVLGAAAGRRMQVDIPKAIFSVPEVSVPESEIIEVTFTGNCYQSALDAADEITVQFL